VLPADVIAATSSHMLNSNGSGHARLRRLVNAAFTRRRIEQLTPRIQQITDELLDMMADAVQAELIDAFAYPLPITVICELLGVPAQRRAQFRDLSSITAGRGALGDPDVFLAGSTAMVSFLRELVAAKRADPTDDLLSSLVAVRDGADQLSDDELTSMAWLLLVAGHETTVNLIGNGEVRSLSGNKVNNRRVRRPMPSSAVLSRSTERSRCGRSIQVIVSDHGVRRRARRPDKDHTDLPGAWRE
jgi:cytochrome P450